jgi:hypothetical protein
MSKYGVSHDAENDDSDDDTNPQAHVMQVQDAPAHLSDAFAHIQLCSQGTFRIQ